jgi:hypothetical protein
MSKQSDLRGEVLWEQRNVASCSLVQIVCGSANDHGIVVSKASGFRWPSTWIVRRLQQRTLRLRYTRLPFLSFPAAYSHLSSAALHLTTWPCAYCIPSCYSHTHHVRN